MRLFNIKSITGIAFLVILAILFFMRFSSTTPSQVKKNTAKNNKVVPECLLVRTIDKAMQKGISVCILILKDQKIVELPQGIGKLVDLNDIDLSNNNFSNFPTVLLANNKLLRINLSHNNIDTFPDNLDKLSNLQILDFSYNNIKTIPDRFLFQEVKANNTGAVDTIGNDGFSDITPTPAPVVTTKFLYLFSIDLTGNRLSATEKEKILKQVDEFNKLPERKSSPAPLVVKM